MLKYTWMNDGLLFDLEDGGGMFLRYVDRISTDHTALYPRREIFKAPHWEPQILQVEGIFGLLIM
jgi:hypothetical protein